MQARTLPQAIEDAAKAEPTRGFRFVPDTGVPGYPGPASRGPQGPSSASPAVAPASPPFPTSAPGSVGLGGTGEASEASFSFAAWELAIARSASPRI